MVRLEENYRSTGSILTAANALIANNGERLGKTLRSNLGPGKLVRVWEANNPEQEAERIAADIKTQRAIDEKSGWEDFCVLYRASFLSRQVEFALRDAGIPYHVSGGLSFFDRAEIQDLLAYLRLISNASDDVAFLRAISRPRRGVGDKALGLLSDFSQEQQCSLLEACLHDDLEHRLALTLREFGDLISGLSHMFEHSEPDDAFDALLERSLLERAIRNDAADEAEEDRRMNNVMDLRRWWLSHQEAGGNLESFLQHIFLLSDNEQDEPEGRVRLMTVHAAKGLEFDSVYICGVEDGLFPHKNATLENRMEEERRLMYVAMTRARFRLTLSSARTRRRFGQVEKTAISPFLKETDQAVLRWVDREAEESPEAQQDVADFMALFEANIAAGR